MSTSTAPIRTHAQEYWTVGYTTLRGVFSRAQVEAMRAECARLFSLFSEERDLHNYRLQFRAHTSGKAALDRIDPVLDISPLMQEWSQNPRILSAVAEIFEEPGLLFKDKVILKTPGTHGYRAHQDYTYWQELPAPPDAMLSALIAVDDSNSKNGELQFYPGLHHTHLRDPETPSNIFDPGAGLVPDGSLRDHRPVSLSLQAGDAVLFHPLAPHESDVNESAETRCSVYFSYSAKRYGHLYAEYYANYHRYLRKDRAGEGPLLHFR
jgi:2-aminoethylphosphonate dioxygenase